jgi:hypothetical protein
LTVHTATAGFWRAYQNLPLEIQALADKNFALLRHNPKHPSLHFKPVKDFWSARVGSGWRALALASADGYDWFWIGSHQEYDRIIK